MEATAKLSNLQLELIKLFSFQLNDSQLFEVRDLLSSYFAEKASKEMDKLWESQNWSTSTMDNWANEHLRTAYKD